MLHLLLDENISPKVAEQAGAKHPAIRMPTIFKWRSGTLRGVKDTQVLMAAKTDGLTLVTYDVRTLRPLVTEWAAKRVSHAGVIFIDVRTISQEDIGGQVRALVRLWEKEHRADWTDRLEFLAAAD